MGELVGILMCGKVFSSFQRTFNFLKSIPAGSVHYLSFFCLPPNKSQAEACLAQQYSSMK
jgi:hypothetical protein